MFSLTYDKQKRVPDGVYVLTSDMEVLLIEHPYKVDWSNNKREYKPKDVYEKEVKEFKRQVEEFFLKYPEYVIASAYETQTTILISKMPTQSLAWFGSGFNYGSTNIIEKTTGRILILAEND